MLASWLPHGQADVVVGPTLTRERLFLGVAEDHPLAVRDHVSVEDVADYEVLPMEQVQPLAVAERWIPRQQPGGRTIHRFRVPLRQMAQEDPGELRGQIGWWIRTGRIVLPVPERTRDIHGPGIVWVPISDMAPMTSALVWLRGASDRRLQEFVRVAEGLLADR